MDDERWRAWWTGLDGTEKDYWRDATRGAFLTPEAGERLTRAGFPPAIASFEPHQVHSIVTPGELLRLVHDEDD